MSNLKEKAFRAHPSELVGISYDEKLVKLSDAEEEVQYQEIKRTSEVNNLRQDYEAQLKAKDKEISDLLKEHSIKVQELTKAEFEIKELKSAILRGLKVEAELKKLIEDALIIKDLDVLKQAL